MCDWKNPNGRDLNHSQTFAHLHNFIYSICNDKRKRKKNENEKYTRRPLTRVEHSRYVHLAWSLLGEYSSIWFLCAVCEFECCERSIETHARKGRMNTWNDMRVDVIIKEQVYSSAAISIMPKTNAYGDLDGKCSNSGFVLFLFFFCSVLLSFLRATRQTLEYSNWTVRFWNGWNDTRVPLTQYHSHTHAQWRRTPSPRQFGTMCCSCWAKKNRSRRKRRSQCRLRLPFSLSIFFSLSTLLNIMHALPSQRKPMC